MIDSLTLVIDAEQDSPEGHLARLLVPSFQSQGIRIRVTGSRLLARLGSRRWWPRRADASLQIGLSRTVQAPWVYVLDPPSEPFIQEHPETRFLTADHIDDSHLPVIPYPIPEMFYAPGDQSLVFEVTRTLRLESRPRLISFGPFREGRGVTRMLSMAQSVLGMGGELILVDSLDSREALAPVVKHLRLSEQIIFTPPLSMEKAAGLLHNADALIAAEEPSQYPYWLNWAAAAGLPMVAIQHPGHRSASGGSALLLELDQDHRWAEAVTEVLTNQRLRERMIQRGFDYARGRKQSEVLMQWVAFVSEELSSRTSLWAQGKSHPE